MYVLVYSYLKINNEIKWSTYRSFLYKQWLGQSSHVFWLYKIPHWHSWVIIHWNNAPINLVKRGITWDLFIYVFYKDISNKNCIVTRNLFGLSTCITYNERLSSDYSWPHVRWMEENYPLIIASTSFRGNVIFH